MLRTIVLSLALALPGVASAQQFRDSAVGAEVVADNGQVVGQVQHVTRDRNGRIVSAEISNQEPASAPYAPRDLVADNGEALMIAFDVRNDNRRQPAARERAARR